VTGPRVLLLGATSEIGLAILKAMQLPAGAHVVLAGRDRDGVMDAAATLPKGVTWAISPFDALEPGTVERAITDAFKADPIDVVIPAFGVLGDQAQMERDPSAADELLTVNVVAQVRALLVAAACLRQQRSGTLVVLSSVASVRPRRANYVYGASKAALDACARGLADSLVGSGVRVLLVRPGFVIGRMTHGMKPAPLASTPDQVGTAVAKAMRSGQSVVWVPPQIRLFAVAMRLVPPPLWRRIRR
jgi:decaprenylphospho-beta-D-erythro-pentofuranosid-2-ulose 2-reductase